MGLKTGIDYKQEKAEFARSQQELIKDKSPENYGFKSDWVFDFATAQEALAEKTLLISQKLYTRLGMWFDLPEKRWKEQIILLLQSQLLRKKSDQNYRNLAAFETEGNSESYEFLKAFVKEFRVILANYGCVERFPQLASAFSSTLGLEGEIQGICPKFPNSSRFFANQKNSTAFSSQIKRSKAQRMSNRSEFEVKNQFAIVRSRIGSYQTSDGKSYDLILVKKGESLKNGQWLEWSFILAADISDPQVAQENSYSYSLKLGKKVVHDYLKNWQSSENN